MMNQTLAILLDAYRELQSKKMFWIVLILNVLVVALFSVLGVNSHSLTILWYEIGDTRRMGVEPAFLYKYAFSTVIVGFWFTWIATLLALISTAGIFPDFLSSGSIDLFLAKPISRLRLFFTKYLAGLLFVAFQVTIFTFLSFLVLGIRAGMWEPGLFFAIPVVLIFFSYLFSICVLLGTWTRSTIAALMLTLLAWTGLWLVDYVDRYVTTIPMFIQMQQDDLAQQIKVMDRRIEIQRQDTAEDSATKTAQLESERANLIVRRDNTITPQALVTTQHVLFGIKSFVPKTRETIVLLDRVLFKDQDLQSLSKIGEPTDDSATTEPDTAPAVRRGPRGPNFAMQSAQIQLDRQHPIWWILGTSLLFEAACLALAAWHFCTRDF